MTALVDRLSLSIGRDNNPDRGDVRLFQLIHKEERNLEWYRALN